MRSWINHIVFGTTLLCAWMLCLVSSDPTSADKFCSVLTNSSPSDTEEQQESGFNGNDTMITADVVRLIGILGWTSITVLYDSHSEKAVEKIILDSGVQLQGIRFLKFNTNSTSSSSELDTLLHSLHVHLFPHLNFLLIGPEDFVVNLISRVASHDVRYRRTTDFRHSSRWLIATSAGQQLIETLHEVVGGHIDNVAVTCSQGTVWPSLQNHVKQEPRWLPFADYRNLKLRNVPLPTYYLQNETIVREADDFRIMTWSMSSSPPRFTMVTVTPSVSNRVSLLDSIFPNIKYGYNNRTFTVTTLMYAPFTIRREEGEKVIYEGYCFEVLNLIAQALNFSIHLVEPADGEWGLIENDSWTGLVGQMEKREVDMVVAPLTMHEDRAEVMDFILPAFYTENVDILYRREDVNDDDVYIVLKPYKYKVLICIASSLIGIVLIIFCLEKWAPFKGTEPKQKTSVEQLRGTTSEPLSKNTAFMSRIVCPRRDTVNNTYTIFWNILGTIFRQGASWDPVASSTRVLMSGWWLLTLVLSAGYSAYLVASLAVTLNTKPFRTLQDVVDSTDFNLGIMSTGIIKLIFEKSKRPDFKQAWAKVLQLNQTDPGVLAESEDEHVQKVLGGKYCWIVDVTTAEKSLRLDCDLDTVGVRLIGQQLTIGVPTGSPLKQALEEAMSAIADSGLLGKWWRRWQKTRTSEMCPVPPSIRPISVKLFIGPLYVAAVGIGVAGLALIVELVKYRIYRHLDKRQMKTDR